MSFSQEMKDFLGAYQAGQKINASRTDQDYKEAKTEAEKLKTKRDNDPETLQLATDTAKQALANSKASLANTQQNMSLRAAAHEEAKLNNAASRDLTGARRDLINEQANMYRAPAPGSGLLVPGAVQPTPGAPVLPIGPSTLDTGEDLYAEGGLVPDEEPEEPEGVLDTAEVPAPAAAPTDVSARARDPNRPPKGLEGVISPALVEDARREGMKFGIEKAGLHQPGALKTPAAMLKARQIAQGMGGLSEEEMKAARAAVDPEGKLSEGQRNIAALGSVYQFWANKNEPEKAQRVAFQMLQHFRGASQRYAAIAAKAAEGGNVDLATKAALKAYANVPDGNDLELLPNPDGGIMYAVTGPDGEVKTKGIATPQQLAASAMGLATGGFDKALLSAAGAATDTGAVKTGGKTQSAGDRAKEAESVGGEIEKMKTAWTAKNKDKPIDEEEWAAVSNAAQHIYQQNPKSTPNEVASAAYKMLSMGDDPEKPGFKVKPGEEGKPSTVDFGGKLKVQLDDDQLESILNQRAARVKAATDAIDKKMAEGDEPGFVDKALEAGKTIAGGVSKIPSPVNAAAGAVKGAYGAVGNVLDKIYGQHIPEGVLDTVVPTELKQRVTSDLRKIDSLIRSNVSNPASNPGAIPVDDGDRPL